MEQVNARYCSQLHFSLLWLLAAVMLATKAAKSAAESNNERLPAPFEFNLFSHTMMLIPLVKILKTQDFYFYCFTTTT